MVARAQTQGPKSSDSRFFSLLAMMIVKQWQSCYDVFMKRKLLLAIILLIIILVVYYNFYFAKITKQNIELPQAQSYQNVQKNVEAKSTITEATSTEEIFIKDSTSKAKIEKPIEEAKIEASGINLAVPFTSQAPTANWDQPFQDACEEASLLMVDYYYQDKKLPDKFEVENILKEMVAWQEQNWGGHENLSVVKVVDLAMALYNQKFEIVENLTAEKIKKYLQAGRPVIVPADGKKLDNPNFTNGGPAYHMLVIKGYIGDKFITNDPGTRKGADFIYSQENLLDSIGDWDENKKAANGGQLGLVFMLR
jgi:hypothetical protein